MPGVVPARLPLSMAMSTVLVVVDGRTVDATS